MAYNQHLKARDKIEKFCFAEESLPGDVEINILQTWRRSAMGGYSLSFLWTAEEQHISIGVLDLKSP